MPHGIIVEQLSESDLQARGVMSWPIWTCDVSRFDWQYGQTEQCYLLKGRVIVETAGGSVEVAEGDFVTFPSGLSCTWDVRVAVEKHYTFR